jgi:hypothetical protein
MGASISLSLINFAIDWGWNNDFKDHSPLFRPVGVEAVIWKSVAADGSPMERTSESLFNSLHNVAKRVELLGHTIDAARLEYAALLDSNGIAHSELSFDKLHEYLVTVDVTSDPATSAGNDFCTLFGEVFVKKDDTVIHKGDGRSMHGIGYVTLMEKFHPWSSLRLLADNPANLELPVAWDFGDVVAGGWANRGEIVADLAPELRFLIVTEGSSDAKILAHALKMLRPEIADFFYFVDMEEGYPFSGTGNLHRFCQGLVSIGILNRVLIIYDNDAEGSARYTATRRLAIPSNMRVMKLPDLAEFEYFKTIGPNGAGTDDINGQAAAIECYLDLTWRREMQPYVRWNNFNKEVNAYQGTLIDKESYARAFLDVIHRNVGYDFGKINIVLDSVIAECTAIAEALSTDSGRRRIYR